ncbi:F-box protein CPR1-like [Neltuma alba]|uniref:F-box protein CPR1-like n=1 Tax=Neltuma alba TaxID=207710 RepID=UPI0010A4981A|nr:F-box protein CPR1-like [Prosopis alba]
MRSSQSSTMKQTILDGDTPYLPQEIIRNILTRIPVKPLIRLQSVCKNWKNLIKTPSFITDHLPQPAHHNRCLLFQRSGRSCGVSLNLFLFDCEKQLHEVHNPPEMGSLPCGRIVSSSNGLILYVKSYRYGGVLSFFLWNPAIRKIKQVSRKKYDFDGNFYIGFGYSPIVDDYKTLVAYVPEGGDEVDQVEVYSLSTQRWKQIEFRNLEGVYLCSETIPANGAMFWRGSTFVMKDCQYPFGLVVAFDIAMETFTLIPLAALESNSKDKLTVHENKLGVITLTKESTPFSMDTYLIDLCVLDKGMGASQERWSWTKKFSIRRTFLDSPVPLGFLGDGSIMYLGG